MLNAKGILNCPNCGAPISSEKCPYCGTVFYDFSTIELNQPAYIKIKHDGEIILCKAILRECRFALRNDYSDWQPLGGNVCHVITGQQAEIDMNFSVVYDEKGHLFTVVEGSHHGDPQN